MSSARYFCFHLTDHLQVGPTTGHFTSRISLSLSPKFGLRPKISQKVKSFSLSDSLRPNFEQSDY